MKKNRTYGQIDKIGLSKMIKIMRFTIFILFLSLSQTFAVNSYSQEAKLSLDMRNARVEDVIDKIEKNSEFFFMYNKNMIDVDRKVDIQVEEKSVNEVLDKIFANTDISYSINNRQILLINNRLQVEIKDLNTQQQKSVSGKVTDTSGGSLPGVSVVVKGTTTGTITDIDGKYTLTNVPSNAILQFSFVGMKTQEFVVGDKIIISVILVEETVGIEEVVAIGYGVQKKSVVTGAISGTNAEEMKNQPIYRLDQALQGRVTGITTASSSGQPGASSTVRVRGTTSINNSEPLYVVDGTPIAGNIDYINHNDIESIEVLKDAATAAIYGARSAAGVILVNTKKGKINAPSISYNGYFGLQGPERRLGLLNATEYATLYNERAINSSKTAMFANLGSLGKGTDWQSEIFSNDAAIQNHDFSISGATDKVNYYTSFGYFGQEGIVLPEISNYQRYNVRVNVDYQLNDWVKVGEKISYSYSRREQVVGNDNVGGPLIQAKNMDPLTPVIETDPAIINLPPYSTEPVAKDKNGNYYALASYSKLTSNPLVGLELDGPFSVSHNINGNFYIELNPVKGLLIKSSLGLGGLFSNSESFGLRRYNGSATNLTQDFYGVGKGSSYFWNLENTTSYSFNFNKHNFVALAGSGNYVDNITRAISVNYFNIPVDSFEDASLNWGVGNSNIKGSGLEGNIHKVNSLYGRLIYNFDEKYLFTGVIRRDGSSRFGSNNKFGYFPSASVGWVVSREGFWKKNNYVDFLKIRGSYGATGSDNIGDFKYVSVMQGNRTYTIGDALYFGYAPEAIVNPDLRWEATSQLNIGFDATFLKNFRVSADWFDKRTKDMLLTVQIPAYAGAGNPTGNIASMKNTGFEVELGYKKSFGNFVYDVKGNVSHIKNEVTDIGDNEFIKGVTSSNGTNYEYSRLVKGFPFNSFYGFESDGIFQTIEEVASYKNEQGNMILPKAVPGDFKWKDLNNDGIITEADRKFLGNSLPDWTYGINFSASYKNWDLNMFGQGVAGNLIYDDNLHSGTNMDNWTTRALDRWHGEGTSNTFPILLEKDLNENFLKPSRFQLYSGDYFRLKTLQVGYSLPKSVISKANISRCRIYVGASNLFTITKYPGYDPEIGGQTNIYGQNIPMGIDRGVYPQARSFMMGLNLTF